MGAWPSSNPAGGALAISVASLEGQVTLEGAKPQATCELTALEQPPGTRR